MPLHLLNAQKNCTGSQGTIAVQSSQTLQHTEWLLRLSAQHPSEIMGIIGWVDLRAADIVECLSRFKKNRKFLGVRYGGHSQENFLDPKIHRGIEAVTQADVTFDIPLSMLKDALAFVPKHPRTRFVLDLGVPSEALQPLAREIALISLFPNVAVKFSGVLSFREDEEAHLDLDDIKPCLDYVYSCFGSDRIMIGSDWEVRLLGGDCEILMPLLKKWSVLCNHSSDTQAKLFGANAKRLYKIEQ